MASGVKLSLEFLTGAGTTATYTYNYADPEVTASKVKALMNKMIEHGTIFKKVPVTKNGAKLIVTTETELEVAS